ADVSGPELVRRAIDVPAVAELRPVTDPGGVATHLRILGHARTVVGTDGAYAVTFLGEVARALRIATHEAPGPPVVGAVRGRAGAEILDVATVCFLEGTTLLRVWCEPVGGAEEALPVASLCDVASASDGRATHRAGRGGLVVGAIIVGTIAELGPVAVTLFR